MRAIAEQVAMGHIDSWVKNNFFTFFTEQQSLMSSLQMGMAQLPIGWGGLEDKPGTTRPHNLGRKGAGMSGNPSRVRGLLKSSSATPHMSISLLKSRKALVCWQGCRWGSCSS